MNLQHILKHWNENRELVASNMLGYVLNERLDQELCLQKLRGHDHLVVSQLKEACKETEFYVCLANVLYRVIVTREPNEDDERYREWGIPVYRAGDNSMNKIEETACRLTKVANLDGDEICNNVVYNTNNFIIDKYFKDSDTIEEDDYNYHNGLISYFHRATVSIRQEFGIFH